MTNLYKTTIPTYVRVVGSIYRYEKVTRRQMSAEIIYHHSSLTWYSIYGHSPIISNKLILVRFKRNAFHLFIVILRHNIGKFQIRKVN